MKILGGYGTDEYWFLYWYKRNNEDPYVIEVLQHKQTGDFALNIPEVDGLVVLEKEFALSLVQHIIKDVILP